MNGWFIAAVAAAKWWAKECSFLKKRTKKLLSVSGGAGDSRLGRSLGATIKNSFFQKRTA
jgi:hypothetical protein